MNFKQYLNETNDIEIKIQTLIYLTENIDNLNEEDLFEGVAGALNRVGLKAHKSTSIISYIKKFTTGVGKVILYLIKGDAKKAQELIKEVKKEDVLDFLVKLDSGTLHLISGPIHTIDAWTGWHIAPNVNKKIEQAQSTISIIKDALIKVKDGIDNLFSSNKVKHDELLKYVLVLDKELK